MDNYELAVETAEKCCQANTQFAEISEVRRKEEREHQAGLQIHVPTESKWLYCKCVCVWGGEIGQKANSKGFSFCLKAGAGVETGISQLWDHFTTV